MSGHRFLVVARKERAEVEFAERAELAVVRHRDRSQQSKAEGVGSTLWGLMREAGVASQDVTVFLVYEGDENGMLLGSVHPVLSGARASWFGLYRADQNASCFRSLGYRHRLGDALDCVFQEIKKDVLLPHKP